MLQNPIFMLLDSSIEAYIIFNTNTLDILYQNKLSFDLFNEHNGEYNNKFYKRVAEHLCTQDKLSVADVPFSNRKGVTVFCHVEASYYENTSMICCKITPQSNEITTKKAVGREDIETIPLSAILRLTTDILFHIDLETKVLSHAGDLVRQFGLPKRIENFPACLTESTVIHPDDLEDYIFFANNMSRGFGGSITVRVRLLDGTYEWFQINSTPISDRFGKPIEILGKLKNVHKQKILEKPKF